MAKEYLLVDTDITGNTNSILDSCFANNQQEAERMFSTNGWMTGETVSLEDLQNDAELTAFENSSAEC